MASRKAKIAIHHRACDRAIRTAGGRLLPDVPTMMRMGAKGITVNMTDVRRELRRVGNECFREGAKAGKATKTKKR